MLYTHIFLDWQSLMQVMVVNLFLWFRCGWWNMRTSYVSDIGMNINKNIPFVAIHFVFINFDIWETILCYKLDYPVAMVGWFKFTKTSMKIVNTTIAKASFFIFMAKTVVAMMKHTLIKVNNLAELSQFRIAIFSHFSKMSKIIFHITQFIHQGWKIVWPELP